MCPELHEQPHGLKGIERAARDADAGGFVEVPDGNGNIPHSVTEVDTLDEELRVEEEVVGVSIEGNAFEDLSLIGSETGVKVGDVLAEDDVFDDRQSAIGEVFDEGHSAVEGFSSSTYSRAENDIADVELDEADGQGDDTAVVLVVGVDHDDVIGAAVEGGPVTGFLIAAVAPIFGVLDDGQTDGLGEFDGFVFADIIDEDDLIDGLLGKIAKGSFEGSLGVVCG